MLAITPTHWPVMEGRAVGLRASLAVLERGGPLLLGRHGAAGSFYQIGGGEEGIFVYFPLLSRLFGVADPVSMVRYSYIVLFALSATIYPIVFYKLTHSQLAGLAAPAMLLVCVRSLGFDDIYWIPAWGALTLLPLIYLLARDWPRFGLLALVGITLAAGWVSSVRANSGLAIAVPAAIVLLLRRWPLWRLLPGLALLILAYISINAFVFTAIREDRNHRMGNQVATALRREQPSPHIWHTMYIGLGYLPNDYGIRYEDGVANARVQRDAPGTGYLSARYDAVIRAAYFDVLGQHPLEVIKQYAAKIVAVTAETAPYLLIVLLTLPAMLLLGRDRRAAKRWALLSLPAIVVGFLPAMIAIPVEPYEQGLYGVIGAMGIVGLCWVLGQLEAEIRIHGSIRPMLTVLRRARSSSTDTRRNPVRLSIGISIAALIAMCTLIVGGYFVNHSAERWQGYSSGVLVATLHPDSHLPSQL